MKQTIMFSKLNKVIKDADSLKFLIDTLIIRAKENKPISDNPMIDGMNIAWMLKNRILLAELICTQDHLGRVSY